MSNGITFSDFWYNSEIPGHEFVRPAIWIERTVRHIFSELPQNGCDALLSVIERVFLSIVVIVAIIPVALFALLVGLPSKAIGYIFLYEEPVEEGTLRKSTVSIKQIPPDGNCAFVAFQTGMDSLGTTLDIKDAADFRIKSSRWIAQNFATDSYLRQLTYESIEEYLEVRLKWLELEEEQIPIALSFSDQPPQERSKACKRLAALPSEKEVIRKKIQKIQESTELSEMMPLLIEYLEAIKNHSDTNRIYASRAHYYAFTRMFNTPVNIEIYMDRGKDYYLLDRIPASEATTKTIRFLHKDKNHVDFLEITNS